MRLGQSPQSWQRAAQALGRDRQGAVAVVFGLGATVLLGLVGGGIDYARLTARRSQLQSAVDAGVLAGGNALKLASSSTASVIGITDQTIQNGVQAPVDSPVTTTITVPSDKASVFAHAEQTVKLTFGGILGLPTVKIAVQARANVVGSMRLCMLALDPAAPSAFDLEKAAQVTATGCTLYSNSGNPIGMTGKDLSMAKAQTICSAGGYSGVRANFTPSPQTGCPVIPDPLKDRPAPTVGACTPIPASAAKNGDTSKNLVDQSVTLDPGTYCGGLHVTKNAVVTLKAGIYAIKDGPLIVDSKASLSGTDVGFYFMGDKGGLLFDQDTTISLAAPTTGVMAGLLMSEERSVSAPVDPALAALAGPLGLAPPPTPPPKGATKPMRTYRIISDNARTMLGTIYLPAGRLVVDAKKPVADQSAYTVIVAQQINLYEGPNLVLNANYAATSVPVPKGVGPVGGRTAADAISYG